MGSELHFRMNRLAGVRLHSLFTFRRPLYFWIVIHWISSPLDTILFNFSFLPHNRQKLVYLFNLFICFRNMSDSSCSRHWNFACLRSDSTILAHYRIWNKHGKFQPLALPDNNKPDSKYLWNDTCWEWVNKTTNIMQALSVIICIKQRKCQTEVGRPSL